MKRKPLQLRLPEDLKDWIETQSRLNGSSQNSEVIRSVRERLERQKNHQPVEKEPKYGN